MTLPAFPVDDTTLDMLEAAMNPREHGDPDAESSSVWELLTLMSELAGSDTKAVKEVTDDGSDVSHAAVLCAATEHCRGRT